MKLSAADQALGRLVGVGQVLPNPHLVSAAYRRREAVSSLAIEGTQTSLSEVLSSEAAEGARRIEVREVQNYVNAFDYGLERLSSLPISLRLIRELHERLMHGVAAPHQTPGEFRTTPNWIGPEGATLETAVFVPPPPDQVMECLDDWERFLHEDPQLPHLVRCALVHYQFETIHPFLDGNGRLGRLLISFYLVERGVLDLPLLYVSPYLEARRPEYYDGLQRVRQYGEFEAWIEFFLEAVTSQALDAVRRAESLLEVFGHFRDRLREARIRGSAVALVDQLLANPYITASRAAKFLGVSHQGATYSIERLVEADILQVSGYVGAARLFVAKDILDVLEAPTP